MQHDLTQLTDMSDLSKGRIDIRYLITNADVIWHDIRWSGHVHCECGSERYYRLSDGRYKCKDCGAIYSDTTGTLLHHSKVDKWKWLWCIYKMSSSKGISNLELSKDIDVNVKTAWLMQQKVRYAMSQDDIKLSGVIAMDEEHIGGWCNMHFNKKMDYMREHHFLSDNKRYKKSEILSAVSHKKHLVVSMVDESGKTIILHTPNPITKGIVEEILERYTNDISLLVTDESKLYQRLKDIAVEQSNHSKNIFITTGGHSSNVCENRFSWVNRKWYGIYTHTSPKYLQLYLNQMSFSVNHKNDKTRDRFKQLLYICTHTYVKNTDITNYNYLANYNYKDVYEEDRLEAQQILQSCSIVTEVITKHHQTYKRN